MSVGRGVLAAAIMLGLAAVTVGIACTEARPDALARHGYLVPVVIAGATGGVAAGLVTAAAAVLLDAPFVLPHVEREGLTRGAIEGLASFALLVFAGAVTGALTAAATRERRRYDTLVRIQRALADGAGLTEAAERVRAAVEGGVGGGAVALIIDEGERPLVAGDVACVTEDVAAVRAGAGARFVPDVGGHPRPRRAMLAPVLNADRVLGVLVLVRDGEIDRAERATVEALGAHIGVALENARLAAAQRRFAAELAEKVAAATRELHAMDRAKSEFVAVASHELRTPLTALRGFSELLVVRTFSAEEVKRFARVMQDEADRLSRIVDDLLDLSRLEQGLAPPLRRARLEPATALLAVGALFDRPGIAHRVEIDCPPDVPAVDADPDALDRILKNLISNAMKYSPPGRIRVAARARGRMVEFVVEDDGPGIAAEALPRLFEPYFRVDDGANAPRGSGLGLAVVRALVEAHGGRVSVESARGIGTRVRVTIPGDS